MVRFKNRYALVEFVFEDGKIDDGLTAQVVSKAIRDAIEMLHGDYGIGCTLSSLAGSASLLSLLSLSPLYCLRCVCCLLDCQIILLLLQTMQLLYYVNIIAH